MSLFSDIILDKGFGINIQGFRGLYSCKLLFILLMDWPLVSGDAGILAREIHGWGLHVDLFKGVIDYRN